MPAPRNKEGPASRRKFRRAAGFAAECGARRFRWERSRGGTACTGFLPRVQQKQQQSACEGIGGGPERFCGKKRITEQHKRNGNGKEEDSTGQRPPTQGGEINTSLLEKMSRGRREKITNQNPSGTAGVGGPCAGGFVLSEWPGAYLRRTQTKPSEAGLFGSEGTRGRSEKYPAGRCKGCGL